MMATVTEEWRTKRRQQPTPGIGDYVDNESAVFSPKHPKWHRNGSGALRSESRQPHDNKSVKHEERPPAPKWHRRGGGALRNGPEVLYAEVSKKHANPSLKHKTAFTTVSDTDDEDEQPPKKSRRSGTRSRPGRSRKLAGADNSNKHAINQQRPFVKLHAHIANNHGDRCLTPPPYTPATPPRMNNDTQTNSEILDEIVVSGSGASGEASRTVQSTFIPRKKGAFSLSCGGSCCLRGGPAQV
ncbi:hypothetical protein B0T17DRAFT_252454 [Bombardia bombarda]|uniref:Uncharacterized protein n=1 Tax=Bombardia bombarda TaxID=252184 RepID=A0AA40C4H2_9PEZI|nr:hypothetical protein B0T17DRAFT_252454 [Bombardia bombarda]